MTTVRERGTRRQYLAIAIAVVCSSKDDRQKPVSWLEERLLGDAGSPP
ncbi:hypothetical protein L3Q67_26685 [Saccharothrix sp. AJ9571]|nr:hypothetical protein L3Q67_26685 [Saccharothrix sp. AJ9571]